MIKEAFVDNPPTAEEQNQTTEEDIMREVWTITTIDDYEYSFDYKSSREVLKIKKYQGDAKYVIVPSFFEIDGKEFEVYSLGSVFSDNKNIKGIIISEGIENIYIDNTIDNCKNLECLYIPESLTDWYYDYFFINIDSDRSDEIVFFGASEWQVKNQYHGKKDFKKAISYLEEVRFEATEEDCMRAIFE